MRKIFALLLTLCLCLTAFAAMADGLEKAPSVYPAAPYRFIRVCGRM